jgi:hypothetical protein
MREDLPSDIVNESPLNDAPVNDALRMIRSSTVPPPQEYDG